jgi:type IV pilus assembly protein PilY1
MARMAILSITWLALAVLSLHAAMAATPISTLPLKASTLAKPNVIFGIDDSGSMDFEVLQYTNDGSMWWRTDLRAGWGVDAAHPNPGLRTRTALWFNTVGEGDAIWQKFSYLFPNGGGQGAMVYADAMGVMPTRQFAFLRWSGVYQQQGVWQEPSTDPVASATHNPLFYNPLLTYKPWPAGVLSTGPRTFAAANPRAAYSHPVAQVQPVDLTTDVPADTRDGHVFGAMPGMTVPGGVLRQVCDLSTWNCSAWTTSATDVTVGSGTVMRVAMSYFPATYWVKEACTPQNSSTTGDSCTLAPDGSTLKRYEIRPTTTSYPSGRNYANELQNFANWYQYYRKRNMMLAAAMGETLQGISGMRLGVVGFNALKDVTLYDADATSDAINARRVAGFFYENYGTFGTPTREALAFIGQQFRRTDKQGWSYSVVQMACQRNSAFIVTDGFALASNVALQPWDAGTSAATWGSGAPYANTPAGGLADIALRMYTNNPRPPGALDGLPAGAVPATAGDSNTNLHVNTYGLTIGTRGLLFLDNDTPAPTDVNAWPDPSLDRSPAGVDDLWHATLNGRGQMFLSTTPNSTAQLIRQGLNDILSKSAAQGGSAVSTVNLSRSDGNAYQASYNPAGWSGDLVAVAVDATTGSITNTTRWSAASLLDARDWTTRVMASHNGTAGVPFTSAGVGALLNPASAYGNTATLVNYLRGDRSLEGTAYKARNSRMGAVISAEPVVDSQTGVVYVASSDGLLHAFDTRGTQAGRELWAYAPRAALTRMGAQASPNAAFSNLLDGTPVIRNVGGTRLLVSGMGAPGRGYFALDVTQPRNLNNSTLASKALWEFPSSSMATIKNQMGQTLGKPAIATLKGGQSVVIVSSGYNVLDGIGRLWVLDAKSGAVLKTYQTPTGSAFTEVGLSAFSVMAEPDGTARYVYAGDLLGNVWRFDLEATGSAGVQRLAQLRGPTGAAQPVTAAPELLTWQGQRIVFVGTGRLLHGIDFGNNDTQTLYAIADGSDIGVARNKLAAQLLSTAGSGSITTSAFDWATQRGWYMDLPAGEQLNTSPLLAYGALTAVSNKTGTIDCSASARLYAVDALSGGAFSGADFVVWTLSDTSNASAPMVLLSSDGKTLRTNARQFSDGSTKGRTLTPNFSLPPAKTAWRELRR